MEVKPDTGINIGSNPFYRPSNSTYGSTWMSSGGQNPLKSEDVPLYPDVVSIEINFNIGWESFSFCLFNAQDLWKKILMKIFDYLK
jgi:hypothetical protein